MLLQMWIHTSANNRWSLFSRNVEPLAQPMQHYISLASKLCLTLSLNNNNNQIALIRLLFAWANHIQCMILQNEKRDVRVQTIACPKKLLNLEISVYISIPHQSITSESAHSTPKLDMNQHISWHQHIYVDSSTAAFRDLVTGSQPCNHALSWSCLQIASFYHSEHESATVVQLSILSLSYTSRTSQIWNLGISRRWWQISSAEYIPEIGFHIQLLCQM